MVKSGQAVATRFTLHSATGAAANADSLPTATLIVNGVSNGAAVTVTSVSTGAYSASVTLPSLSAGDIVEIEVQGTIATVACKGIVWKEVADTRRVSESVAQTGDSYARIGAAGAGLTAIGDARLANLDAAVSSRSTYAGADTAGITTLLSRVPGSVALAADLAAVAGYLDTEVATILAAVDTEVAAIKAKTDTLPSDPADQSQVESAITAAQAALAALIAALNDLSQAETQAAAAAALAAYPVPLIGDIEDAIAAGSGATPATFWTYDGPRTLTQSGQQVAAATIEGTAISVRRGDRGTINLTGLGSLAGRTKLWFTVKARPESETDEQAKIQIIEADGLVRLNGAAAGDAAGGAVVVTDENAGNLTITLSEETMAALAVGGAWRWDLQVDQPSPGVWTPREGDFTVRADVTRATS